MKHHQLLSSITLSLCAIFFSTPSLSVQKCQDADGKWHYGDVAVSGCENSNVTTLNDRGFVVDQLAAPKTEEQLLADQQQLEKEEAERIRLKVEEDEKIRVLSIYETEADIDRQRDNQLSSVDGNILVHEAYLKSMAVRIERLNRDQAEVKSERIKEQLQTEMDQANGRVEKSTKELAELRAQKVEIMEKFKKEKEIYLALKSPK